jgi:hypothetical protein
MQLISSSEQNQLKIKSPQKKINKTDERETNQQKENATKMLLNEKCSK